jgi:hypothetical protein
MKLLSSCLRSQILALLPFAAVIGFAIPCAAQLNMPVGGGTLTATVTDQAGNCYGGHVDAYLFNNFKFSYSFTSPQGTRINESVALPGSTTYVVGPGGSGCPTNGAQPSYGIPLTDSAGFYRMLFTPTSSDTGTAQMESFNIGTVNPSYVVLSVIYAPPGSGTTQNQSYVDYTNTTEVGTDTSLSNSFSQSNEFSVSGVASGQSFGLTGSETQEEDTSSSIAINQTSSVSDKYPGLYPAMTAGLNHDNDIILLWLNASMDCEAEQSWTPSSHYQTWPTQTNCILYDTTGTPGDPDDPLMDVVQLPVGWLNGDFTMETDVQNILANHGVTSAYYQDILNADPYASCKASTSCVQNIGANATRFTLASGAGAAFPFEDNGTQTLYTVNYSSTKTQGQGASDTHSVSFSVGGGGAFLGILDTTLKNQNTLTWTNKWSETTTKMVGQTAAINIAEPSPSNGYDGPSQFEVYQDNVYGTFMCYPTQ